MNKQYLRFNGLKRKQNLQSKIFKNSFMAYIKQKEDRDIGN